MGSLVVSRVALAAGVVLAACGVDTPPQSGDMVEAAAYPDLVALVEHAITPTCSLNNGVCHNSNNYPDLHTAEALVATVAQRCNVDLTDPTLVHDACEPPADRFVVPSAGVDARIVSARLPTDELELDVRELTEVELTLASTPAGLSAGASDTEVRRGDTVFALGDYGVKVASVDGDKVVLDLDVGYGNWSAKRFFDVRVYPPGPLRVHVGDPNGNGLEGAQLAPMPLVAAGDPMNSYLFMRLVDPMYGELMPRQCRTWNDAANRALACWIRGLVVEDGKVVNAYDPIDYAGCTDLSVNVGRCD